MAQDAVGKDGALLQAALDATTGARRRDYGDALPNHAQIAIFWTMLFGVAISPVQVAEGMIFLKLARGMNGITLDNYVDAAGYSSCANDIIDQTVRCKFASSIEDAKSYYDAFKDFSVAAAVYQLNIIIETYGKYKEGEKVAIKTL